MNPLIALATYSFAYLVLFATWAAIVFCQIGNAGELVQYVQLTLASLTGHVFTVIQSNAPVAAAPANLQAGRASPVMLGLVAALALGALAGCAGFQQAVTGYEAGAVKGIRAAEDNNIAMWTVNACGTPFSAAIRNPQIVAPLLALCLPSGTQSSPALLFDAIPHTK